MSVKEWFKRNIGRQPERAFTIRDGKKVWVGSKKHPENNPTFRILRELFPDHPIRTCWGISLEEKAALIALRPVDYVCSAMNHHDCGIPVSSPNPCRICGAPRVPYRTWF